MTNYIKTLIVIFIIVIITITAIVYKSFYNIKFEKIGEFEMKESYINNKTFYWFTIRHPEFDGFLSEDALNSISEKINIDFDFDNYTYIFVCGHELKKIEYSYSFVKDRQLIFFAKTFIGQVTLSKETTNKIYVYKIRKTNIDCDYHERSRGIIWE